MRRKTRLGTIDLPGTVRTSNEDPIRAFFQDNLSFLDDEQRFEVERDLSFGWGTGSAFTTWQQFNGESIKFIITLSSDRLTIPLVEFHDGVRQTAVHQPCSNAGLVDSLLEP